MPNAPKDDETKFNETLKRMLESPPKPHTHKPDIDSASKKKKPKPGENTQKR